MSPSDATLQAFADTILPGCRAQKTDLGNPIDPLAIAGVDPLPGAVQADALAFYHHPEVGFDALSPAFLAALEAYSVPHGGDFLHLAVRRARAGVPGGPGLLQPRSAAVGADGGDSVHRVLRRSPDPQRDRRAGVRAIA